MIINKRIQFDLRLVIITPGPQRTIQVYIFVLLGDFKLLLSFSILEMDDLVVPNFIVLLGSSKMNI